MNTMRVIAAISFLFVLASSNPRTRPEPTVLPTYSTFLGGSAVDDCDGIGIDRKGALYLGCHSDSQDLPTGGSRAYTIKGDLDGFVMKLSPDGTRVEYLTQLGGSEWEAVMDVGVDDQGYAYVVGTSYSPNLPVSPNALRRSYGGGEGDAFVARLSPMGTVLWLTYLGGSGLDDGRRIAIDAVGNAYVAGRTASRDFPTSSTAFQASASDGTDAFVTKLDSAGQVAYSTFVGGSGQDIAWGLAVDPAGNAYLAGDTRSRDFPLRRPLQSAMRGEGDCFVAIINSAGTQLLFASYWGGSAWDSAGGIALDNSGRIYFTGWVHSADFPVTRGAFQTVYGGNHDAFVTAFEPMGRSLRYSTYLGGNGDDSGVQVVADAAGRVFVVGGTESPNFPTTRAYQSTLRGTKDGFVVLLNAAGSAADYSTYFGGSVRELLEDAVGGPDNSVVVSGLTSSKDFPTIKPFRAAYVGGLYDIVVAKFTVTR